jgi:hypothetical protein
MSTLLPSSSVSDFDFAEKLVPSGVPQTGVHLVLPKVTQQLTERRIYLYLEVLQSSAASYQLLAEVLCLRNGNPVGKFPCQIADYSGLSSTPHQSAFTLFNAGGSPVGDSLTLQLAQPFVATIPAVVIQPLRINAEIDSIQFRINSLVHTTVTGWRCFLACLSTKY